MDFHLANLFETVSDAVPERPAVIACHADGREDQFNWREFDQRASRVAGLLTSAGLSPQAKFGIYMRNRAEYLEAHHGGCKARMIPINVNYRYRADELVYLLDNADAEAVFFQAEFRERIEAIRDRLPRVKLYVQVDDGSGADLDWALDYEQALAAAEPMPRIERPGSDIYMLYTGGTTGMPKGVMYEQGGFAAAFGFVVALRGLELATSLDEVPQRIQALTDIEPPVRSLTACPLMHGTGMWLGHFAVAHLGGATLTMSDAHFDPDSMWKLVEKHQVTDIVIVGDAFAIPMLGALRTAKNEGRAYDISSLRRIGSSGVMWSREVKDELLEFGDMMLIDSMGSSEGGMGISVSMRGVPVQTAQFELSEGVCVFDEQDKPVEPGSDSIGMIATSGLVPLGYYKDEVKSAKTFREVNGVRYSFPGDFAKVEADGTITLLGRGSNCINTGGEKVFPEEVEEAIKLHQFVRDCLVVGLDDERFGQRVVALASLQEGTSLGESDIIEHARGHLAGYKLPRRVIVVDTVRRAVNGKADYGWARDTANTLLGG